MKINMLPLQLEHFTPPHPGKKGQLHEILRVDVFICLYRIEKFRNLFRRQILSFYVVYLRLIDVKRDIQTQIPLNAEMHNPFEEVQDMLDGLWG
jgi:hypothetical protein